MLTSSNYSVIRNYKLRSKVAKVYNPLLSKLYAWLKMMVVPYEQISVYVPKTGKVLDIGCGYGILSIFLALECKDRNVYGIDPNLGRIASIGKILHEKPINVQFKSSDVDALEDSLYDCVVMEEVLHHVPKEDQQYVLNKIGRIMQSNGVFILRENNKRWSFRYLFVNLPAEYMLYPAQEKGNFRTNSELVSMLEMAGFVADIYQAPWYSVVDISIFVCRKSKIGTLGVPGT